tara:strand:- start:1007 stop:1702 length:696 start_codon:yes stop_codon:yes gene_type:complete
MAGERILIVDDEAGIQKTLKAYLENEGYATESVTEGDWVLPRVQIFKPDVVILDIMLPGIDGIEVLRRLRQDSSVLVLMLSAKGEESDRLVGLKMGADDYVVKPFSPREVVTRVGVLLRRGRGADGDPGDVIRFSRITVDPGSRQAWKDATILSLTPIEFDLLLTLSRNSGRVLSRDQLIDHAWGDDYYIDERVVDVHVRRLRRKIEDDPREARIIATARGAGYRLDSNHA